MSRDDLATPPHPVFVRFASTAAALQASPDSLEALVHELNAG